jgi:hypothetical protein
MHEKATRRLPKNGTCLTDKEDNRDTVKFNEIPLGSKEGNPSANLAQKMRDDERDCWSCPTHDAILQFANERYSALTRKAVFQLQRIKASGVYGDDYRHKTLWDEYCHEVQEGPYDLLDDAWDKTLGPVLRAIVGAIPRHEAALLTIGAIWDLDEDYETAPGVMPDLIQRNLQQMVSKMAGTRDMSRFDPTLF